MTVGWGTRCLRGSRWFSCAVCRDVYCGINTVDCWKKVDSSRIGLGGGLLEKGETAGVNIL